LASASLRRGFGVLVKRRDAGFMNFSKAIAVYLKLVGAAVAINLGAYPLYREHQPENFDSWSVLNWFMASSLLLTLVTTWLRRSAASAHDRNARAMFIFAPP